ncbi:MAG: dienelactone hydrolase family protein [Planctomycetes bacterium]|nr:dienelactone hydrolase family protein [Planctomycetota bacterium]
MAGTAPLFAAMAPGILFAREQENVNVNNDIAAASLRSKLSMQFRGITADEAVEWQKTFRAKMNELLGHSAPPKKWSIVEEGRTQFADHVRHDLLLKAEDVPTVPVYLLVPKSASESNKAPAVLAVHGHGRFGNHPIVGRTDLKGVSADIEKMNYDYGLQFVRRGYVVAAPCMIPFGRRVDRKQYGGNDPCAVSFVRMQAIGQLPIAANLRDLRWSIDLLQSRPEVKRNNIGCAGLSYGGRMTMMVSAMDKRIKVAAVSGALNLLQERMTLRHSCGSQIVPNLLKYGDYSEIGSLIAPRPCVWEAGSKDRLVVPKWDIIFKKRLQKIYRAYGAQDQLMFDHFEGAHRWNGEVAFPLFDKVLKG